MVRLAPEKQGMTWVIRRSTRLAVLACAFTAAAIRLAAALQDWSAGSYTAIEAYSFRVVFPAMFITCLVMMHGTRTREGLLMRFGTILQLLMIICIPPAAEYLALGFPVVFMVVELLVAKLPPAIARPIEKVIIQ